MPNITKSDLAFLCLMASLFVVTARGSTQTSSSAATSTTSSAIDTRPPLVQKAAAQFEAIALDPQPVTDAEGNSKTPTDTAQWRMDSAQQFLRLGVWFKQHNDPTSALHAQQKALSQLAIAAQKTNDASQPGLAAHRYELLGLASEQLLGDSSQAVSHFQNALQHDPASTVAKTHVKKLSGG